MNLDIDRFKAAISAVKHYNVSDNEFIYLNDYTWQKLLSGLNIRVDASAVFLDNKGIRFEVDELCNNDEFFICPPGLWAWYKRLVESPLVDKSLSRESLQKIATGLYDQDLKDKERERRPMMFDFEGKTSRVEMNLFDFYRLKMPNT